MQNFHDPWSYHIAVGRVSLAMAQARIGEQTELRPSSTLEGDDGTAEPSLSSGGPGRRQPPVLSTFPMRLECL
jgi:hypothetical protein